MKRLLTVSLLFSALLFTVGAQTPITVINPSFEEPGLEKIKGWDGECADPGWTGLVYDIPGWTSDEVAWDSGVETGWTPTDGDWTAFLMGQDAAVYQITDHVIQPEDDITLSVDARITWQATLLEMLFFYVDDAGNKVPITGDVYELTGEMAPYESAFQAAKYPESVGHLLGIWFDNVSDNDQSWLGLDNVMLFNKAATEVKGALQPSSFVLKQNHPNPFNPTTEIRWSLMQPTHICLQVFDAAGRLVAQPFAGLQDAGEHQVTFNGQGLRSGIYLYRLTTPEGSLTRKMMLVK